MSDQPLDAGERGRHIGTSDTPDDPALAVPGSPEWEASLLKEVKERFRRCQEWESDTRSAFLNDLKFVHGDSYNGYQWPNSIRKSRDVDDKPCLTLNQTRQHCLQIINDGKKNTPSISYRPTGGGASYESAQCYEDIARHIQYQSSAKNAYDKALQFQVWGGIGYLRLATDYITDAGQEASAFEQEIMIRPINDPLGVYLDPDAKEPDKSDGRFAFVFSDIPEDLFKQMWPKYKNGPPTLPIATGDDDWLTAEHVRIAEYFYVTEDKEKLIRFEQPDGTIKIVRASTLAPEVAREAMDNPMTRWRETVLTQVHWALIIGNHVEQTNVFPSRYIPIIPVVGEESIIDGRLDRKGHVRALVDPQRMYNYWASASVEFGALQTKTPWVAPLAAIEEMEGYWNTANTENHSVLPWKHMDENGQPIPPPVRPNPPSPAPMYVQGLEQAKQEMMLVSGQVPAYFGQPGNERSAAAIQERERNSDTATYQFTDGLATAIRHVGRIILDMIPRVYDTRRILLIQAEDRSTHEILIDPQGEAAFRQEQVAGAAIARRVLNPKIGQYSVQADVGPGWGTKREEAFNALSQILTEAPQLTALIGDLLLQSSDFPLAREAAERLRRMVPPQALGTGPSANEQMLMQRLQQSEQMLRTLLGKLTQTEMKLMAKDQLRDVDVYEAETKRMTALAKQLPLDPKGMEDLVRDLVNSALTTSLSGITEANAPTATPQAPMVPGAQLAPDGQWYAPHPTVPGRWMRVERVQAPGGATAPQPPAMNGASPGG